MTLLNEIRILEDYQADVMKIYFTHKRRVKNMENPEEAIQEIEELRREWVEEILPNVHEWNKNVKLVSTFKLLGEKERSLVRLNVVQEQFFAKIFGMWTGFTSRQLKCNFHILLKTQLKF